MRRAQSSIEIVLAVSLLSLVLSAAGLVTLNAWRTAELSVGRVAAERAASRGGDPVAAAQSALPLLLQSVAPAPAWRAR